MKDIAIFGHGRMGAAIANMLRDEHVPCTIYDSANAPYNLRYVIDTHDVFVSATPPHATMVIAREIAQRDGKLYLDLSEDVTNSALIRAGSRSIMIPMCGFAPGAVSIIAGSMLPCEDLYIAVGALPIHPVGQLQYALNWSTEGLVNEYSNPCPAIVDGVKVALNPLEDVREFGHYEAFNTSGGLGTLVDTLEFAGMKSVRYQTIRYKGHAKLMRFMRDDLGFGQHREAWIMLLEANLPRGGADVACVQISGGEKSYLKEIYGNNGMSAIQRTTAAGLCAVLLWAIKPENADRLQSIKRARNWIACEDIPLAEVQQIKCWRDVYES